ncbi:unnamed protein product, partial [Symbiodinium sp. KB8]
TAGLDRAVVSQIRDMFVDETDDNYYILEFFDVRDAAEHRQLIAPETEEKLRNEWHPHRQAEALHAPQMPPQRRGMQMPEMPNAAANWWQQWPEDRAIMSIAEEGVAQMGMIMPGTFLILLQGVPRELLNDSCVEAILQQAGLSEDVAKHLAEYQWWDSHVQTDSFRRKYVIRKGGWRQTARFTVHDEKVSLRGPGTTPNPGLPFASAMIGSLVVLACVWSAAGKPRQPKETYVKVPAVPEPSGCGLANLLRPRVDIFSHLGEVTEKAFVQAAEAAIWEAAKAAWTRLDANQDGNLDIDELAVAVRSSWKSKRFQPPSNSWIFLFVLADAFKTMDLSRSARLSASAMEEVVEELLRSVKFLDERKDLFDKVAGPGVGDEEGTFSVAAWEEGGQKRALRADLIRRTSRPRVNSIVGSNGDGVAAWLPASDEYNFDQAEVDWRKEHARGGGILADTWFDEAAHTSTRSQEPPTTAPKEAQPTSEASTDLSESDDDVIAKFQVAERGGSLVTPGASCRAIFNDRLGWRFDFRNSTLRHRYDSVKYMVKRLETIAYEVDLAQQRQSASLASGTARTASEDPPSEVKAQEPAETGTAVDLALLGEMKERYDKFTDTRDQVIKRSRDVGKAAKNAVYALQRADFKKADGNLALCAKEANNIWQEHVSTALTLRSGGFTGALEEVAEAVAYRAFLKALYNFTMSYVTTCLAMTLGEEAAQSSSGIIVETESYFVAKDELANAIIVYRSKYQVKRKKTVQVRYTEPSYHQEDEGEAKSKLIEGDAADIALDKEIRSQKRRLPSNLPVLNLVSHSQSMNHQLIEQLMHAEEKMKIAHQEDVQRHEEIAMSLLARMNEMVQEDQGSTMRIEELERQRDLLSNAMGHVNQVHQKSLDDHYRGIEKIEEASHAQHQRDEELATSLHQELVQLRSDAAQAFTNMEQQAQGEGQQLAMEYRRLVDELNQKAHETLQFKMEASQNLSSMAIMKEQMELMKNEENAMRDEATKRMSYLESGARELRREEFAKSETMLRLREVEMTTGNDGGMCRHLLFTAKLANYVVD